MDYLSILNRAVSYLEDNLEKDPSYLEVAEQVYLSPFHFMRIWKATTGYTIDEYVRKRRLYQAALDIASTADSITEIAYRYGYLTPESFTKAFRKFHGASPSSIRKNRGLIHQFLPLSITTSIKGGQQMEYQIEKVNAFAIIGLKREFDSETAYNFIPKFWGEAFKSLCNLHDPNHELIKKARIGQFGVCVSKKGCTKFDYYIAGLYQGEKIPEGYEILQIPTHVYAKFRCLGQLPGAMQSVNTRIYQEWLPNSQDYEMDGEIDIEYYSDGDSASPTYESEIWLPIKKK